MIRIFVLCEGHTELGFVKDLIAPELPGALVVPFLPGRAKLDPRGGDVRYSRVRPDILRVLGSDRNARVTTMLDYYRLGRDFPARDEAEKLPLPRQRVERIEQAMLEDMAEQLGTSFDKGRYCPYLSLHEFESLLFSDPRRLAEGIYEPSLESALSQIRRAFPTPEEINGGRETAPSKRLRGLIRRYDKWSHGILAARAVGLPAMERDCPHFAHWMARLRFWAIREEKPCAKD